MNIEEIELRTQVEEAVSLIRVQLSLKNTIELISTVPADIPATVEMDAQRLKQILINLLKNATKFTFSGFIALTLKRVKLLVTSDGKPVGHQDAIAFDVYDTGIGISQANIKHLFTLYGKLIQNDNKINREGIGLGLHIVKRMAEQLGGTIKVASEEGKFTRFVMILPVRQHFLRITR